MLFTRVVGPFLLLVIFVSAVPLQAAWEIRQIDEDRSISSVELVGDLAAYEKEGDIYLYRISTGQRVQVTHDRYAPTDLIIELDRDILWYWAHDRHTSIYDLHRYFVPTGRDERLFSFDALIAENQGTADEERLVIWKDHEWCLFEGDTLKQVTFSGQTLIKQQAWLTGDCLVWRAVAEIPGVYLTHLPTKQTVCIFEDEVPPTSLWVSGLHAAWVTPAGPVDGQYQIVHYRLDTGAIETVGTSEASTPWQLAVEPPQLVWLRREGPSWQVMRTNLEDKTEVCLYASDLSMHTPRVSGNDVLLITRNCQGGSELCSELNLLNQKTGILTQLTYFGLNSVVSSPRIDAGRIAFRRDSTAFPFIKEAFVGFETTEPPGWTLSHASGSDAALNLALVLTPLAIAPWHHRLLIRRKRGPTTPQPCHLPSMLGSTSSRTTSSSSMDSQTTSLDFEATRDEAETMTEIRYDANVLTYLRFFTRPFS
jgi:hypothetical protein